MSDDTIKIPPGRSIIVTLDEWETDFGAALEAVCGAFPGNEEFVVCVEEEDETTNRYLSKHTVDVWNTMFWSSIMAACREMRRNQP